MSNCNPCGTTNNIIKALVEGEVQKSTDDFLKLQESLKDFTNSLVDILVAKYPDHYFNEVIVQLFEDYKPTILEAVGIPELYNDLNQIKLLLASHGNSITDFGEDLIDFKEELNLELVNRTNRKLTYIKTIEDLKSFEYLEENELVYVGGLKSDFMFGGGLFEWREYEQPEYDEVITYKSSISNSGAWVRILKDKELTDDMFGYTPETLVRAIRYCFDNNYNLTITGNLFKFTSQNWYYLEETLLLGVTEGSSLITIRGSVIFRSVNNEEVLLDIRNWKGQWDGDITIQGFDRIRHGVTFTGTQRLRIGTIQVIRCFGWGLLYNGGNNNSMEFHTIDLQRNGQKEVVPFTIISASSGNSSYQRAELLCKVPEDTVFIDIAGRLYTVVSRTEETISVFPGLDPAVESEESLTYFSGGGLYIKGSDGGLATIESIKATGQKGVSVRIASLYGPMIRKSAFELNQGPAYFFGSASPTGIHFKTIVTDVYLEDNYPYNFVQSFNQSYAKFINVFNMKPEGYYNLRDKIRGSTYSRHLGTLDLKLDSASRASSNKFFTTDNKSTQRFFDIQEGLNSTFFNRSAVRGYVYDLYIKESAQSYSTGSTTVKLFGSESHKVRVVAPAGTTIEFANKSVISPDRRSVYYNGTDILELEIYRETKNSWSIINRSEPYTREFKHLDSITSLAAEATKQVILTTSSYFRPGDFITLGTISNNEIEVIGSSISDTGRITLTLKNISAEAFTGEIQLVARVEKTFNGFEIPEEPE